jgi:hypothetical protein
VNKLMTSAAILPLLAWSAAAQDPPAQLDAMKKKLAAEMDQQLVRMKMVGAVKGPLVKGMPYSADEITETNHVLADGTRIHKETKVTVYRDSEGRTRRETGDSVMINDPVAGLSYVINPKTNTVQKLTQTGALSYVRRESGVSTGGVAGIGEGRSTFDIRVEGDGQPRIVIDGKELDPKQVQEMIAKAKAEGHAQAGGDMVFTRATTAAAGPIGGTAGVFVTSPDLVSRAAFGKGEPLGKKSIEGVIAEGTRNVQTIETGAIGNDRPIQIVNEHWYSEELGMMVLSKRTDPRAGDETFRLTNIRRGDPASYLFQPPPDAHVNERKF